MQEIKYSIVMTHFERVSQLKNTLDSIGHYIGSRSDYEIIIVDDFSPSFKQLREICSWYSLNIRLISSSAFHKEKTWCNPCIPFNIGLKLALSDIVIIQNAENLWKGNILEYLDNNFSNNDYIVFGCYSLNENDSRNVNDISIIDRCATGNGESGWYQHSRLNDRNYHFCTAISKENLEKVGYFDEDFKDGISYDDDYLLHCVKQNGLNIKPTDIPFVIHQYHYSINNGVKPTKNNFTIFMEKISK
jgi:GT2 family glycosyltransferase